MYNELFNKDFFDDKRYQGIDGNEILDTIKHSLIKYMGIKNFRQTLYYLLKNKIITESDYFKITDSFFVYQLNMDEHHNFVDNNGQDMSEFTRIYSKAKYGSYNDIQVLSDILYIYISNELEDDSSYFSLFFKEVKNNDEKIVLLTTGCRHAPSTANIVFQILSERLNVKLSLLNLPTIINVRLPRLALPCENYASLSNEDRINISKNRDHIIPEKNFFSQNNIHVIFGDDVFITGSTADKLQLECMRNGAKSFRSLYLAVVNPITVFHDPSLEERLNMQLITDDLNHDVADFLNSNDYIPILRSLRLIFDEKNFHQLPNFIKQVNDSTWLKLYISALNNDFYYQDKCRPSLDLIKDYLFQKNILDKDGMPFHFQSNYE